MTKNEARTRFDLIDPKLRAAGWKVVPYESSDLADYHCCAIEEYPTDHGPADYALCVDGKILGIVEAKKISLGPQNVLTQAERYSKGASDNPIRFAEYFVPFLYSTNGEVIWHHDIRYNLNRSRQIALFHTPNALTQFLEQDHEAALATLAQMTDFHPRLRDYQVEANQEIEKALNTRKRQMLVAMATGTGKTFMTVNQVYRLLKSGVAKRILFLVDRRALAAQAVRAFASFEAEPGLKFDKIYEVYSQRFQREDFGDDEPFDPKVLPQAHLLDPKPGQAFVYVCTIQRLTINLFGMGRGFSPADEQPENDAEKEDIPIHAFDLIVADECHRGYTASEAAIWKQTLDHFDAVKIGLTATPAAHTTTYFKEVVFRYEYERAVREGHLVDYDVVTINSDVRMKGVFLSEGDEIDVVNTETGATQLDFLEDEREFDSSDVEQKVTAPDSNKKILEEINRYAQEHEARYGRFPKTLIFSVNDLPHTSHADQLVDLARDIFGRGDKFVQKITGRVDRPLQQIREFRNRIHTGVVVTVDMLSTGVDIPDLEYIVFLRPVKSRILFEQMVGRGTRKGENIPDKSHFVVFDCFGGSLFEYFKSATSITAEPPQKQARTVGEIIEDIWENRDREYNTRVLIKRLHRIDKTMAAEARQDFSAFIPNGDVAAFARELMPRLEREFTDTMSILRNDTFQKLLVSYPRPRRSFIVAPTVEDSVSSEWIVRGLDGKEYKPDDYIMAFESFIQENEEQVEAIQILLNRPREWRTKSLVELREKLTSTPQRFTIENLQKAHEIHYSKALVDIISMVKKAANEKQELYTAQERIQRAFMKVTGGRSFNAEQRDWLERIRTTLVENLTIDKEDFDIVPSLSRHGGWSRANREFNDSLNDIIAKLNEAVAA